MVLRKSFPCTFACALAIWAGPPPAGAVEAQRSPPGLDGFSFSVLNNSPGPISCTVTTAHWYAVELGTAAPGTVVSHAFWISRSTGEVDILNTAGDLMPVQVLWCGLAGRSWETRASISLPRQTGRDPKALTLECRQPATELVCTPLG